MTDTTSTSRPQRPEPFARCHMCSAVLPNQPEDRREHLAWHKQIETQIEALRRNYRTVEERANQARADAASTLNEITRLRGIATADPELPSFAEIPDEEVDEFAPDETSQYSDDDEEEDDRTVAPATPLHSVTHGDEDDYFTDGPDIA